MNKFFLFTILVFFTLTITTVSQDDPPRLSPKASVSQVIGYTEVSITYSRPGVKERDIWGGLVPYNQVWRTGANEATTIEFNNDVVINGNEVPKGKYGLFTIPGENKWTIILNKVWDQWGAFNYNAEEDFLRFNAKPEKSDFTPRLLFTFEYVSPYSANVLLEWNHIEVPFLIETN
ncbi:MAG: DUF2911 domain-containing protein [Melioribacteraceae bacterium]|nr:DUF2911 domain-containing protein [Melioribacteraceae bacterium]